MSTSLTIQLLGGFRVLADNQPVTKLNTPRLQALLTYLILNRAVPQSRQQVAFLFWPESNDAQARTNLRNALHQVRSALPNADDFLVIDTQTIQWRPDAPFLLDLAEFAAHLQIAQQRPNSPEAKQALESALALYRGELLPGCYDDWILSERTRWQEAYFAAQEQLIRLLENQQEYRTAIQYAQRLLQQDPLRETTYGYLMQLYALNGDRAAALRTYHTCATTLVRELGVEPGPAIQGIYERLLNAEAPAPAPTPLRSLSPLVGRESAWTHLQTAWQQANKGQSQLLLLVGEAGIGKTRLAEELISWTMRQGFAAALAHCYAVGGQLAYAPLQEWLRAPLFQQARREVASVWASEVAHLLPELLTERPGLPAPAPLTEAWQRQRLFEALAHLLFSGAPALLLVLDDIQWCDSDTLDWLQYLLRAFSKAQLLVVGTLRREEQTSNLALRSFIVNLTRTGQLGQVELARLDAQATATLAANLQGKSLNTDQIARIYQESEGIPLFVIEMMRAEQGGERKSTAVLGSAGESAFPTPVLPNASTPLPAKVLSAIQSRLLYLSPEALELARVAAVIGRAFVVDVLMKASGTDEDTLVQGLDELWQQQVIREQRTSQFDAERYDFSHDKIREVVYASLSPIRRRFLHRRVAQALESLYHEQLDAVAGQIALHYERAEQIAQALPYYQRAARFAQRISAQHEAMNYLHHALSLLATLSPTPERDRQELALQGALGPLLLATKGYAAPEVEQAFQRAWFLCQQVGDLSQHFQILWGLERFFMVKPNLVQGLEAAHQLLALAEAADDPELHLEAYCALGTQLFHQVELLGARRYLEQGLVLYDSTRHAHHALLYGQDPGVVALSYLAWTLWCLGYPEQAMARNQAALDLAQAQAHPYSQVIAQVYAMIQAHFLYDIASCRAQAEALIALTEQYEFTLWLATAKFLRGWALTWQGDFDQGFADMQTSIDLFRSTGAELGAAYFAGLLAETFGRSGQPDAGLILMQGAFALVESTGDRWCEAELYRLQGELHLQLQAVAEAETSFRKACAVAQAQQARLWELRAVVSLGQLWHNQGKMVEARDLIVPLYRWFQEGFALPDLLAAQRLLAD